MSPLERARFVALIHTVYAARSLYCVAANGTLAGVATALEAVNRLHAFAVRCFAMGWQISRDHWDEDQRELERQIADYYGVAVGDEAEQVTIN